jgi:hypothetical protein
VLEYRLPITFQMVDILKSSPSFTEQLFERLFALNQRPVPPDPLRLAAEIESQ